MRKTLCELTLSVPTGKGDVRINQNYNIIEVTAGNDVTGNFISPAIIAIHDGKLKLLSMAVNVARGEAALPLVQYPAEILEVLRTNQKLLESGIQVIWMGYRIQAVQYFTKCDSDTFDTTHATRVIQLLAATFNVTKPGRLGGINELVRLEKSPGGEWKTYVAKPLPEQLAVDYLLGRFE